MKRPTAASWNSPAPSARRSPAAFCLTWGLIIAGYLPAELSDEELADVVKAALADAGATAMGPAMKAAKKGAIVNIASLHADMTYPGMFPYAAAKSGLGPRSSA